MNQKKINKVIGKVASKKSGGECCNSQSYMHRVIVAGIPVDNDTNEVGVCYVFEFDGDEGGTIDLFSYNGGAQTVTANVALQGTGNEAAMENDLKAAFDAKPITYDDVTVIMVENPDHTYHYTITVKNPDVIFSFIFITGAPDPFYAPTITDCT